MSEMPPTQTDVSSDDRLWGLLAYLIPIIIPIIILLMEDKKNRPFLKAHTVQALVLGIVLIVVNTILAFIPVVGCILPPLTYILLIVYAVKAYRGELINIPLITSFVKNQGWA